MIRKHFILFLFIILLPWMVFSQKKQPLTLIPKPNYIKYESGRFHLSASTKILVDNDRAFSDALIFNEFIKTLYGFELQINKIKVFEGNNTIRLQDFNYLGEQGGYILQVEKNHIDIMGDKDGIFYGLQTLKQLLPLKSKGKVKLNCMTINDSPQFSWRGMHLDVCRHFFDKEFIKKYIDFLASYKMNTFHWHLTDDQGWRIEIKKFPNLTKTGAWRKGTVVGHASDYANQYDTSIYGGFFTQDDIREIVAYAQQRHITIVPEIEMPGHSLAALASYPVFSCTGGPFQPSTKWGVFEDVFCPTDTTFKFLEEVLTEVMDLFPGKYIHIGGDEVPKARWRECPHCQALIKQKGLKDENELQSYFIRHIDSFLTAHGRNTIGWDEILEGGLAANAAVMSWRGTEGGIAAAKLHHEVVMTPGGYCYFDYYQGDPVNEPLAIGGYTTVEKVYSYEPTPAVLDLSEVPYVLGAQGNVWTEYIADPKHVEYMVFPRICALAEVLWTDSSLRNFPDFRDRLVKHFNLLDKLDINYSKALFEIKKTASPSPDGSGVLLSLTQAFKSGTIRYSTDSTEPTKHSSKYKKPLQITRDCFIKVACFDHHGNMKGKTEQKFRVNLATGKKINLVNQPSSRYNNGGAFALLDGIMGRIPWSGKEWLGFLGTDMIAEIDLGNSTLISNITVDVLSSETNWIHLPKSIEILVSDDNKSYKSLMTADSALIRSKGRAIDFNFTPIQAQYIRIITKNQGKIPAGKPGEGEDAWLFIDEIMVNGPEKNEK